ncbi:putative pentatricopeptide [Rosa chinensis]|uniref:Putative pentatricopeptide n=1 Tax=Rosa chinensis TaxID=74649 RepID=A0A2P6QDT0_ROSCH|nr:putative pentatricopeptide [Rosa chinensis]
MKLGSWWAPIGSTVAFETLCQDHSASFPPHKFTFPPILKACAKLLSAPQVQIVHTHLLKTGFFSDIYTITALMDSSMKLNLMDDALKVSRVSAAKLFEHMSVKNVVSYNAFIIGRLQNGVPRVVLDVFKKMRACRGENPNSLTLVSVHGLIMKDDGIGVGVRMWWRRACVESIWLLGLGDLRER